MKPLVTIGIPIYKRLHFLPAALRVVSSQDYPAIELIVSDNGGNGSRVSELVAQHYTGSYKVRQNAATASVSEHYNQLVEAASGKYFVLLCDDDEISANFISELAGLLEQYPSAIAAIAMQEIMDESGSIIRKSKTDFPESMAGTHFIRAAWDTHEYAFECFATIMAPTEKIKACGGYPDFTTGTHNDDALLIKLCLAGDVALSNRCCFRWRVYESSHGWSISIGDLAKASREFLEFLNTDPAILEFARRNPTRWAMARKCLVDLGWKTYHLRWAGLYRRRLTLFEWLTAAFALPFIPDYYSAAARTIAARGKSVMAAPVKTVFPGTYAAYRAAKYGPPQSASGE
jgi:glycosyltransferase involved in cell wall biosynthesis